MKKLIFCKYTATIIALLFIAQNAYTQKGTSPKICVETTDKYCIEIVPNSFDIVYKLDSDVAITGRSTKLLEVGKHSICIAAKCEENTISFEVGKGGEITCLSNPMAITATNRKLEFNIVDFSIHLDGYDNIFCLDHYRGMPNYEVLCRGIVDKNNSQIRIFKVVKNLNYSVSLYRDSDEIRFHVDADGQVSCSSNAYAARTEGKNLVLNTSEIQITSKDYKGLIEIGNKKVEVPGKIIIVRNIATPFIFLSQEQFFIRKFGFFIPLELTFSSGKKKRQSIVFELICCPDGTKDTIFKKPN